MNLLLPLDEHRPDSVQQALDDLARASDTGERGSVFTKRSVVDGILDLCGYTVDADLASVRLLEPSFGDGGFLLRVVARLMESFRRHGGEASQARARLAHAIRGVELHEATFKATTIEVAAMLVGFGLSHHDATHLVDVWLRQDDFLLAEIDGTFDVVVGNPPYVRQERIPEPLLKQYRRRFATLYDRADLYVLFFERCLDLMAPKGVLGFICANRWIKNKYGGPLRAKIARGFHLRAYIDMERADAFHDQVDAYPAITIIDRPAPVGLAAPPTAVALGGREDESRLSAIVQAILDPAHSSPAICHVRDVAHEADPWLLDAPSVLPVLRLLERLHPTVEESGARVGIGVATGCDRVFINTYNALPVEPERKLPLCTGRDLKNGRLEWGGLGVVNPWESDGSLAPLDRYPRFAAYLRAHQAALAERHTARKAPERWYRTIDRIQPELTHSPKLLVPDIKGNSTVVFDAGTAYPHHNLYVITSDRWDLRTLQALLRSSVALAFIAAYGVRMAGGFLRFQAQYLRRIRVPAPERLSDAQMIALASVAEVADQATVDRVAFEAYGLDDAQRMAIRRFAEQARVS